MRLAGGRGHRRSGVSAGLSCTGAAVARDRRQRRRHQRGDVDLGRGRTLLDADRDGVGAGNPERAPRCAAHRGRTGSGRPQTPRGMGVPLRSTLEALHTAASGTLDGELGERPARAARRAGAPRRRARPGRRPALRTRPRETAPTRSRCGPSFRSTRPGRAWCRCRARWPGSARGARTLLRACPRASAPGRDRTAPRRLALSPAETCASAPAVTSHNIHNQIQPRMCMRFTLYRVTLTAATEIRDVESIARHQRARLRLVGARLARGVVDAIGQLASDQARQLWAPAGAPVEAGASPAREGIAG